VLFFVPTFEKFERDMIRERGGPHGRPKTAALKIKKIVDLKSPGAKQLADRQEAEN
jgi:hypothetical protein